MSASRAGVGYRWRMLACLVLALLSGCVTGSRAAASSAWEEVAGSAGGLGRQEADAFQQMLRAGGLEEEAGQPVGAALYPEQARRLWSQLTRTRVTQRSFGPRLALSWLLREALEGSERVEYPELVRRAERFGYVVVIRPDGYGVSALDGTPIQRMGPVRLDQGELKVGRLVVGVFYFSLGGVFYPVNAALRRGVGPPCAERSLEHDPLNAALDGAQDAMEEMARALAQSVLHPIRGAEDLVQLPDTVARLLANSPEYWTRYGAMSLEDQVREAARLSTHLLMLYGGGAGAAGRMSALGAELPRVALSAEGVLVVRSGVVAAGAMTLAEGVSGASILHMSSGGQGNGGTDAPKPPGRWKYKTPTTESRDALDYQEQVTGQPAWRVYDIDGVEFDGFTGSELLEAKGPGYARFFNKDGTPKSWYVSSSGFQELLAQARNQSRIAARLKLSLTWHVAEAEVASALRVIFDGRGWTNITVVDTPLAR